MMGLEDGAPASFWEFSGANLLSKFQGVFFCEATGKWVISFSSWHLSQRFSLRFVEK